MVEEPVSKTKARTGRPPGVQTEAVRLKDVRPHAVPRVNSGSAEFDRVLGGGIVPGSVVLVGGDPGIGKSTLLLQIAESIASRGSKVLYVSGEESLEQLRMRADRMAASAAELFVVAETDLDAIMGHVEAVEPMVLIIDSIQTTYFSELTSAPGSVGQIRESAARLTRLAKDRGIATFLIGHVTKEGSIAGPRVLEHMVDVVVYFEGERHLFFRLLRAVKNRFGSTNEVGVLQMESRGLIDVTNPSEHLITARESDVAGSMVTPLMEGTRPMLVEVQALVASAGYGNPRRATSGIDANRVNMILAVLEKRVGFELAHLDSYVNVVGGIRVNDPAADLAVAVSLASSLRNTKVSQKVVVFGEIGLTGEVRGVSRSEARLAEAEKLGFSSVVLPRANLRELSHYRGGLRLLGVTTLQEALQEVWHL
jgi:DNA repair protein RadA/Sms